MGQGRTTPFLHCRISVPKRGEEYNFCKIKNTSGKPFISKHRRDKIRLSDTSHIFAFVKKVKLYFYFKLCAIRGCDVMVGKTHIHTRFNIYTYLYLSAFLPNG